MREASLRKAQDQLIARPDLIDARLLAEIAKRLAANEMRPQGMAGLKHAFSGPDGHQYYSWENVGDMPPYRTKNIMALMRQAEESMSPKDIATISKEIKRTVMQEALQARGDDQKSEALSKIIVLADELTYRADGIIPEDIFFDLAATCAIREDEDPKAIDRTIHLEKYTMIQQAGRAGADFFTVLPTFSALVSASLTTQEGYARLLTNWIHRKARLTTVLQVLSSEKGSKPTMKSSSSSPSKYRRGPAPTTKQP